MKDFEAIEAALAAEDPKEKIYRQLYQLNPRAYDSPIKTWPEFQARFPCDIPDASPSIIKSILTEEEFFLDPDAQVSCFKNMRWCPPFFHKLDFIKIVYILRGSSIFYINGRQYNMQEGHFCIVSPGIEQAMLTRDDTSIAVNILLRASAFIQKFSAILTEQGILSAFFWRMAMTKYQNEVLYFHSAPDEVLRRNVLCIYDEVNLQPNPSSLIQESRVNILLGEMMRRHRTDLVELEGLDEEVYQIPAILADMKSHLAEATLPWLAQRWNMREDELHNTLKRETGYGFSRLLSDLRLQRAANLLEETDYSVEHIMEEIGILDSNSFYHSFRKRYGLTPQQYKRGRIDL